MAPPRDEAFFGWYAGVRSSMLKIPANKKIEFVKAQLSSIPDPPRNQYEVMFVMGVEMDRERKKNVTFLFVAFSALLIYLGAIPFLVASPTPQQMFIFRLIATIFAGIAGGFIPGSLDLQGKAGGFAIRGTSAFALALLVYLVNPPALVT